MWGFLKNKSYCILSGMFRNKIYNFSGKCVFQLTYIEKSMYAYCCINITGRIHILMEEPQNFNFRL